MELWEREPAGDRVMLTRTGSVALPRIVYGLFPICVLFGPGPAALAENSVRRFSATLPAGRFRVYPFGFVFGNEALHTISKIVRLDAFHPRHGY
ncbi:hypothetical protein EV132_1612 [Rhizobium sullae]|nr:hypothetical protein EV132_1612 [Rhizobium sullae]